MMVRPIKFRAWDGKKLVDASIVDFVEVSENGYTVINKDKTLVNVPLMQYTGVKDKNDKEVYEGDVVRINFYWFDKGAPDNVRRDTSRDVYFEIKWGEINGHCCHHAPHYFGEGFEAPGQEYEVIGNIWENPELLKEVKR